MYNRKQAIKELQAVIDHPSTPNEIKKLLEAIIEKNGLWYVAS